MPEGFFKASQIISRAPSFGVARCGACGLYKRCKSPKMPVGGRGRKRILIIGEAPGEFEDQQNLQFVGKTGTLLREELERVGIDMRRDCWTTNSIICRPEGNRIPDADELDYCRPNLTKAIRELKPEIIIPVGEQAVKTVLHRLWRDSIGSIGRWVGWRIPNREPNAWICPLWHPSYVARAEDPVVMLWYRKHLKRISKLVGVGRPWGDSPPDYSKQVEVILNPREAARRIQSMMLLGDLPASFDYETNMLKPDGNDAEIICCSICWEGGTTIAYPWAGDAIDQTYYFLRSRAKKYGANIKFEERWTLREFGKGVRGWAWDCVNGAHICDNREGITSVKFQAFVRLGQPIYTHHIERFFKSDSAITPNQIRHIDLKDLLVYCGIDSIIEYKLCELQQKEIKYHADKNHD